MSVDRQPDRFWTLYLVALGLAALGCVPGENNGGGGQTDISGTVGGVDFDVLSASADRTVDGYYVVTLADTPEFTCSASSGLPMNYAQIVISDVDDIGTFDAAGRVSFNVFENGVSEGELASSGTITIDGLTFGVVDGFIDASGPQSSVSGSFSADICN